MSFNQKYHPYVDELPPYVLQKISKKITEKYQKHEANDYIDSIFKTHAEAYKKKRAYDSQYYSKNQGNLKEENERLQRELSQMKVENVNYQKYLQKFVDYHKANKLPIPKMP